MFLKWTERHVGSQIIEINIIYLSLSLSLPCFSSFKHLIGGLDDVSNKVYEDAEAKAKYVQQTMTSLQRYQEVFTLLSAELLKKKKK